MAGGVSRVPLIFAAFRMILKSGTPVIQRAVFFYETISLLHREISRDRSSKLHAGLLN